MTGGGEDAASIDPDADPPARPGEAVEPRARVLAAIAVGGAIGASARYGAALLWPTAPGAFPWDTFGVNVVGCSLIGVLMAAVAEEGRTSPHPLLRPFLGVGVLGGFTTFSTYALEFSGLLDEGLPAIALTYAGLTVVAALAAVWAGAAVTRAALRDGGRT
ncbi:fluoride efflux transporter FluC [Streptomyces sp. NPDC102278]|uniref:fluoride efflux transporter FluC n=1 Tax=Streptomyces sp. NPDC102278 TaxID=3366152 RepID=UPI0037F5826A